MSSIRTLFDVKVPMRDSVYLSLDVYMPSDGGSYPTILIGTPYDNTMKSHVDMARFFVQHGYAFGVFDVRGRFDSDGDWYPFFHEGPDGYDMVEWGASQPWCSGKIGMMGGSYRGWVQWATAREKPEHLTTMVPTATGGKWMQEFPYLNGIPCLWMLGWFNMVGARTGQDVSSPMVDWEKVYNHTPLISMPDVLGRELPIWEEWLSHPDLDDFWRQVSFTENDFESINIPVLHITGYYDGDQPGALHYYDNAIKHSPGRDIQYMLIGPWDHAGTRFPQRNLGGVDFTNEAVKNMAEVHLKWFDRWLKGSHNEVDEWSQTRFFVMGENQWRASETHWPHETKKSILYLGSKGDANTLYGHGILSHEPVDLDFKDSYYYNPENPVTPSNNLDFYGSAEKPPLDIRYLLRRDDFLVYTSNALTEELLVTGRPDIRLFGSSDCLDTDWFTYLLDVHPDGRSITISHGMLRARYRDGLSEPCLMEPGKVYEFNVEMSSTCNLFKKEHKILLAVTSSEFPRYARNHNTGNPIPYDTEFKIANNSIHHSQKYPSKISLPISS